MHLGIVLENMRREGYEFQTTSPTVILKEDSNGTKLEPFELIKMEVPLNLISKIMAKISNRLGNVTDTLESGIDSSLIIAEIPTRGLFGLQLEIQ